MIASILFLLNQNLFACKTVITKRNQAIIVRFLFCLIALRGLLLLQIKHARYPRLILPFSYNSLVFSAKITEKIEIRGVSGGKGRVRILS